MSGFKFENCTQEMLFEIGNDKFAIRVGATDDRESRCVQYRDEGYVGTMYTAYTTNMKKAENKLLETCPGLHNIHASSNVPEGPGYVYIIKGKKMK